MTTLASTPSLNQLYTFIDKVSRYPVSVKQLLRFASTAQAPKEIRIFINPSIYLGYSRTRKT